MGFMSTEVIIFKKYFTPLSGDLFYLYSVNPDKMNYAAFHLGLHCLQKYSFRGFPKYEGLMRCDKSAEMKCTNEGKKSMENIYLKQKINNRIVSQALPHLVEKFRIMPFYCFLKYKCISSSNHPISNGPVVQDFTHLDIVVHCG